MVKSIRLNIENGVAELVLNQAERGNLFDIQFNQELCDAASETSENPAVQAILIRAEAKVDAKASRYKWD